MFIFLIPLLFDYALGGIYFIVSYRLAAEGYPAFLSGSPMIVWGLSSALYQIYIRHTFNNFCFFSTNRTSHVWYLHIKPL